jgi:hypothetical protein
VAHRTSCLESTGEVRMYCVILLSVLVRVLGWSVGVMTVRIPAFFACFAVRGAYLMDMEPFPWLVWDLTSCYAEI